MNSKTILLVEDNESEIALTKRALDRSNILNKLITVEDGQEALEYLFGEGKFSENKINKFPSLVLLDLNIPRIDGLEVLRRIRSNPKTKYLPVVILSTSKEDTDVKQSYTLGANSYIRKPVDFFQFIDAIQQLVLYWLKINEAPMIRREI